MESTNRYHDTVPQLSAAGTRSVGFTEGESTAQCLHMEEDPINARPSTPEHMKKYRKSHRFAPGQRFIHAGATDMILPPASHRYGVTGDWGHENAADVMRVKQMSHAEKVMHDQRESIYRSHQREPLGKGFKRGHVFPAHMTENKDFRFGVRSDNGKDTAHALIFPQQPKQQQDQDAPLSPRNAACIDEHTVTGRVDRKYDWKRAGIDPKQHRFGIASDEQDWNGVARALQQPVMKETQLMSKRVAQVRALQGDALGRGRPKRGAIAQLPDDYVFGRAAERDPWGTRDALQGEYTKEQLQPDRDLGISRKALTKGLIPDEARSRTFGVPSIRVDVAPPALRSVACSTNYGNEVNAKGVIYPSRFAFDGVKEEDFFAERGEDEIRRILSAVGIEPSPKQWARCCALCREDSGGALTVDGMRHAWNQVRNEVYCPDCAHPLSEIVGRRSSCASSALLCKGCQRVWSTQRGVASS